MTHRQVLLLAAIMLIALQRSDAQPPDEGIPRYPAHSLSFDVPFTDDDVFLGATYSYTIATSPGIALAIEGWGRPYAKAVLVQEGEALYYRYQENRFGVGAGVDISYDTGEFFSLFATGLIEYSWALYAGTDRTPGETVFPVVRAGVAINFGSPEEGSLLPGARLGYQYSHFDYTPRHRIYVALTLLLF